MQKKPPKRMSIQVSPEEYDRYRKKFRETTCRTFSEFFRDVLDNKPLRIKYRSESVDDFLEVAIGLKNELNAIAEDLGRAVGQLRLAGDRLQLHGAIQQLEANAFSFQQKADEIKEKMHQIYLSCIQK